jgi:hypothetical protein
MLTKEQEPTEPWGETTSPNAEFIRVMTNVAFWVAALLICLCEAIVIHGLWFKPQLSLSAAKLYLIPLGVFVPGFFGFAVRLAIKGYSKRGQISLRAAQEIDSSVVALLVFAYISLLDLAPIAFP